MGHKLLQRIKSLIIDLEEFDKDKYGDKDYNFIMGAAKEPIKEISESGEEVLEFIHPLLGKENSWMPLLTLEIIGRIKSEKSVPFLISFIRKHQETDYFDWCDSATHILGEIGLPAVEPLINTLKEEFEKQYYGGYLDEALSRINDKRASEFRLGVLRDYIQNPAKYKNWFNLELFIAGLGEWNKEALEDLKKLRGMKLTRQEKIELESAIENIENPEEYKNKLQKDLENMRPFFEALFDKGKKNDR